MGLYVAFDKDEKLYVDFRAKCTARMQDAQVIIRELVKLYMGLPSRAPIGAVDLNEIEEQGKPMMLNDSAQRVARSLRRYKGRDVR